VTTRLSQFPQEFMVYKIIHRAEQCHKGCDDGCSTESYVLNSSPSDGGWYKSVSPKGIVNRKHIYNRVSMKEIQCSTSNSLFCKRLKVQFAGLFYYSPVVDELNGLNELLAQIEELPEMPQTYFLSRDEADSYIDWNVYVPS